MNSPQSQRTKDRNKEIWRYALQLIALGYQPRNTVHNKVAEKFGIDVNCVYTILKITRPDGCYDLFARDAHGTSNHSSAWDEPTDIPLDADHCDAYRPKKSRT